MKLPGYDDKDRNSAEQLRAMQTEELEVLAEFFRSFADAVAFCNTRGFRLMIDQVK